MASWIFVLTTSDCALAWVFYAQERGVDVIAFDVAPPQDGKTNIEFASRQFAEVREGDSSAFGSREFEDGRLHERTLLLVWPNQVSQACV